MAVLATLILLLGVPNVVISLRIFPFEVCGGIFRDGNCYDDGCPFGTTRMPDIVLGYYRTCFNRYCCVGVPDDDPFDRCQNADICGTTLDTAITGRILFGDAQVPKKSPWQISLRRLIDDAGGFTFNNSNHLAGGVLVNQNLVLVDAPSALLVGRRNASETWFNNAFVVLGEYDVNVEENISDVERQEQTFGIKSITFHPSYRYTSDSTFEEMYTTSVLQNQDDHQSYAFALIELDGDVTYNEWVRPICLPSVEPTCNQYKDCRVTGWGLDENIDFTRRLHVAHVEEFSKPACEAIQFYSTGQSVVQPDGTKCAMNNRRSAADIGDFGGPLVCDDVSNSYRNTLSGIMTYGDFASERNNFLISDVNSVIADWVWTTCRSKLP